MPRIEILARVLRSSVHSKGLPSGAEQKRAWPPYFTRGTHSHQRVMETKKPSQLLETETGSGINWRDSRLRKWQGAQGQNLEVIGENGVGKDGL